MALAKLTIWPEDGSKPIEAAYNPEKYSVNKGVHYAEIDIPGLDEPVLQFIRGENEKVTLDLFFDTTEKGMAGSVTDVRTLTSRIYGLLKVNTSTHAPLRFSITWGTGKSLFGQGPNSSLSVLESMSEEFSLFAPSGEPLRAKLTVTIRLASTVKLQFQDTPRHSSDRTTVVTVIRGQRISDIANRQYGDSRQWRPIADASGLANPRFLDPGTTLNVPALPLSTGQGGSR
jgi:hypothetical protein